MMLLAFRSLTDYILNNIPFVALFLPPHSVTSQRLVCECMGEWCVCALEKTVQAVFLSPAAYWNKNGGTLAGSRGIEGSVTMRVRMRLWSILVRASVFHCVQCVLKLKLFGP